MARSGETLAVFRHRDFRNLWLGSLTTNSGAMAQAVAVGWLMAMLTPSQTMVALVQAAVGLPLIIGGYLAGIIADIGNRRRVMLLAQVHMLVVSLLFILLLQLDLMTPWLALVLTFVLGGGAALHAPSWQASLGDLVPREDLAPAVAINGMGLNLTRSLGPAIGGILVSTGGVLAGFIANALTYPVLILALLGWKQAPVPQPASREPFGSAFHAGLRYFRISSFQVSVTLRASFFGFAACVTLSLLPVVVRDHFTGSAMLFGLLYACFGFGAATAALASASLRARFGPEGLIRLGFLLTAIGVTLIAFSPWPWLAGVAIFITGVSWLMVTSLTNVMIQLITPRWVVGRIVALFMAGIAIGTTLGAWVWGMTAELYGVETALMIAALLLLSGLVWGFILPIPTLDPSEPDAQL